MRSLARVEPVDYLLIGHLSRDLTPEGDRLGGTVAYSALMARALGLRVGLVTAWGDEFPFKPHLEGVSVVAHPAEGSTTFENRETPAGRVQILHQRAPLIGYQHIPEAWREVPIVHLAPIAQDVEPDLVRHFPKAMLCATPQGWLRTWDEQGHVTLAEWPEAAFVLGKLAAAVISVEDVQHDEERIEEMAIASRVLAVTEGGAGVRVYWNGDVRRIRPPQVEAVDTVGAGDIFATAFFHRLHTTRDPWEAARFASELAAISVTRAGVASIPTPAEIEAARVEVLA